MSLFNNNILQLAHNGQLSSEITHEAGLLHGSCLSPILYSAYIDGFVDAVRGNGNVLLYLFAVGIAISR
jgi:hypothetical protein